MPRAPRPHDPPPRSSTWRRLSPSSIGALLLAAAALVALVWANSPWSASYERLWTNDLSVRVASGEIDFDLRHWINDAAMAVFFLVVGLEIKRELSHGHLASARAALLPAAAAIGGMVVPAVLYLAIAGSSEPRGWAIPIATDIALAVGILAVAGDRLPPSLRALLLGLAIVDDIGAIVVIAVVYSGNLAWASLAAAVGLVAVLAVMRLAGVHRVAIDVAVGAALWLALHAAGIHPTLAGVIVGLLTPASRADDAAGRLQRALQPWTTLVVLPVFALANSGITMSLGGLQRAAGSALPWGIVVGLVVGKPLGVVLATHVAHRSGAASSPADATRLSMLGVGAAAGIGFTVSLFITDLALTSPEDRADAKLAILLGSVISATMAAVVLRRSTRQERNPA